MERIWDDNYPPLVRSNILKHRKYIADEPAIVSRMERLAAQAPTNRTKTAKRVVVIVRAAA
jgi:hypothetical protein